MPGCDVIAPLSVELGLNGLKQFAVENGHLLSLEDFTLVFDFSNIEAVAQKMSECPPTHPPPPLPMTRGPRQCRALALRDLLAVPPRRGACGRPLA
jgi:hypothetical protein